MPCDTPTPPPSLEDVLLENDEDPDDSMYEVIDMDELGEMPTDDAIVTFTGHSDAVFCCNIDKTGQYAVSGGQDETAFVWNVHDKSVKFECTGHTDSVVAVSFSSDSKYVCTADMNGLIQVWSMESNGVVWDFDTYEITWTDWFHGENVLIVGSVDGNCLKWDIPDGTAAVFEHTGTGCSIGCISHNDKNVVTGYQDGTIKFWDVPNHKLLSTLTGSVSHTKAVTYIIYKADDSLILTGAEDGTAKVIKASDFKVLWTINACDSDHQNVSVEGLGFCHTLSYIVTGTNCGCLSIWDLQTKTRRESIELESSVVKVICDEAVPLFYAAVGDGLLRAYDIRNGSMVKYWDGHKASIFDLVISSDHSLFLTASEDHTCKIFEHGVL